MALAIAIPAPIGRAPKARIRPRALQDGRLAVEALAEASLAELARRTRDGEREAAQALCLRIKDPIFAYCLSKLRNRHDAEDVTQEVLCAVVSDLDRLSEPRAILGYALGISRNLVHRHLGRGPRKRELLVEDAGDLFDGLRGPQSEPPLGPGERHPKDLLERRIGALNALLAEEPEHVRRLIDMHYTEGRTSAEIAEELGLRPSGVRMRLKRVRDRLVGRLIAATLELEP
jgi:RNA polymerase sigma-70 factor (ECF subfamily)